MRRWLWIAAALALTVNLGSIVITADRIAPSLFHEHAGGDAADHIAFWAAGRLANEGRPGAAYDFSELEKVESAGLGYDYQFRMFWFYPPFAQVFAQPFAALPLAWSMLVWNALGLGALLWAAWRILPDPLALALAAGTGGVASCLLTGQIGLFVAAILGAHLLALRRGETRAGLWLSLLVLKPHTVFAVPVMHLLTGRWRVLLAACAGGVALTLATLALHGLESWRAFFGAIMNAADYYMVGDTARLFWEKYVSLYGLMRSAGLSAAPAVAAQAALSAGALFLTWRAFRAPRVEPAAAAALLCYACILVAPRSYSFDMPILAVGALFQARAATARGWAWWEVAALAVAFALAEAGYLGPQRFYAPVAPLLFVVAWARHAYSPSARGSA